MGLALTVLLWLAAAMAVLIIAVAVTPLHVRARLASGPWRGRIVLAPFGGLLPVPVWDSRWETHRDRAPVDRRRPRPARRRERRVRGDIRPGRALHAAPALVSGLLGAVRVEHLHVDAVVGLEDPAETGMLFGLLCPALYGLARTPRVSLAVMPEFGQPGVHGSFDGAISVTFARLVPPALRFGWRVFGPGR